MPAPKHLYKYLAPERVDFLRTGLLRFTPLGAFNDPFEGRPNVTDVIPPDELKKSLDEVVQEEIEASYARLPTDVKAKVSKFAYDALMRGAVKQNESQIRNGIASLTPTFVHTVQVKFDQLIGALCLTEVPDSLLMWAHYGASHTGFVIEFNGRHNYFDARLSPDDEVRHVRRVLYRDSRPSGTLSSMTGELFTVKSGHWSYEREWRILQPLLHADQVINTSPYPVHLFKVPLQSIDSVILGARTTTETRDAIAHAIRCNMELSHVTLKRARSDDSHFLLRIEEAA